jgi:hypothetical protein
MQCIANLIINLKRKLYMPLFFEKCWFIENHWQRTFCVNTNCLLSLAPDCLGHFDTGLIVFSGLLNKEKNLLFDDLLFYVPLTNFSLIWRRHQCRWRAAKFRPMLGALGLWAGRDRCRATAAVTWDLGFFGLIRRNFPFSRLLRKHVDVEDLF